MSSIHAYQLRQLRRLDPGAHETAVIALRNGLNALANRIIVHAMLTALTRLSAPGACPEAIQKKSPSHTRCDAYHLNPAGRHIRCRKRARYALTLQNKGSDKTYQVHRCQACCDELQLRATAKDATFTIIAKKAGQ